eukprot:200794-Chlamydomonas_euryale.AAC.2
MLTQGEQPRRVLREPTQPDPTPSLNPILDLNLDVRRRLLAALKWATLLPVSAAAAAAGEGEGGGGGAAASAVGSSSLRLLHQMSSEPAAAEALAAAPAPNESVAVLMGCVPQAVVPQAVVPAGVPSSGGVGGRAGAAAAPPAWAVSDAAAPALALETLKRLVGARNRNRDMAVAQVGVDVWTSGSAEGRPEPRWENPSACYRPARSCMSRGGTRLLCPRLHPTDVCAPSS